MPFCESDLTRASWHPSIERKSYAIVPLLTSVDQVRFLTCFGLALGISVILTPLVARAATAAGIGAKPRQDRWHKKPTALLGATLPTRASWACWPVARCFL